MSSLLHRGIVGTQHFDLHGRIERDRRAGANFQSFDVFVADVGQQPFVDLGRMHLPGQCHQFHREVLQHADQPGDVIVIGMRGDQHIHLLRAPLFQLGNNDRIAPDRSIGRHRSTSSGRWAPESRSNRPARHPERRPSACPAGHHRGAGVAGSILQPASTNPTINSNRQERLSMDVSTCISVA